MHSTDMPDTILDHPALAGRTVFVGQGGEWVAFRVRPQGGLAPGPDTERPTFHGWRTSTAVP